MLKVCETDGNVRERYYGFDMALDHVGKLLGVDPHALLMPEAASDMKMELVPDRSPGVGMLI